MPQYTHSFDDIDFLIRTCTPEQIAEKFGVSPHHVRPLMDDPKALASFLADAVISDPEPETVAVEAPQVFEQIRVDYGYQTTPRGKYVFIRPCPPEHPARIVFPKSHQSDQEIGFIHAVHTESVPDLQKGLLVVYDRFAAIGAAFDVVDESGEPCFVVQIDQAAISAVLQRRDLNVVD
jgi:hypothetical protein